MRRSHVDSNLLDLSGSGQKFQHLDTCEGVDLDVRLRDQLSIIHIFGEAPYAVAAHFSLAAIRIEHAHLEIRNLGWQNEDQAIATDAELAVAELTAQVWQGILTR